MTDATRRDFVRCSAALLLTALTGCWPQREMTVQEEDRAYLRFIGNRRGLELQLDGGGRQKLGTSESRGEDTLWQVQPGRHRVELYRGGERVLRRDVYVGLGQTLDLTIP